MRKKLVKKFDSIITRFDEFFENNRSRVVLFILIFLVIDFMNEYYFQATETYLPFKGRFFLLWLAFLYIFKVRFIASFYVALVLMLTVPILWIFGQPTFAATNAAFAFLFLVFGFLHRFASGPLKENEI